MSIPDQSPVIGDVVRLKKPHPCGVNAWQVTRVGMDVGLKCTGCGRVVRIARSEFERRLRGFVDLPDEEADMTHSEP